MRNEAHGKYQILKEIWWNSRLIEIAIYVLLNYQLLQHIPWRSCIELSFYANTILLILS